MASWATQASPPVPEVPEASVSPHASNLEQQPSGRSVGEPQESTSGQQTPASGKGQSTGPAGEEGSGVEGPVETPTRGDGRAQEEAGAVAAKNGTGESPANEEHATEEGGGGGGGAGIGVGGGAGQAAKESTGDAHEASPSSPTDQLKAKLPEVLKEAGVEGQTVRIWGVTLDPSSSSKDQDAVLQKFLDAREGDVDAAAAQLASTLKWRKSFDPESAAQESFPTEVFGGLGVILPGRATTGEPVTLNLYGEVKDTQAVFGDLGRFLRWRVGLMEKGVALLKFDGTGPSTMIQIHDYQGVSVFSRDAASKKAASEASKLFSDHYPELLSRKFFVNVPGWAAFIFKLFSNFLSARTLSKFSVLGSNRDELHRELGQVMDDSVLPARYGGTGDER